MVKKSDMVKAIAQKTALTQVQSEAVFDAFMDELTASLAKGEKVQFMGIGAFEVKRRAARTSRNPRTGEPVEVPASNYVSFSVGKKLKDAVQAAQLPEPEVKAKPAAKKTTRRTAAKKADDGEAKPAAKKTTRKSTKKTEEK